MKNLLKTIFFIFLLLFIYGCEINKDTEPEDFIIEFGTECGWCAGQEYITVSASKIDYLRNIPCGDEKGTIQKNRVITSSEWDQINVSFDYSLFTTLEYNDCNVCADGCDEIIRITENNNSHELRYDVSEEVEGMEDLRQLLGGILHEMRNTD